MANENKKIDQKDNDQVKKSAVDRLVEASHGDDSGMEGMTFSRKKNKLDSIPSWIKALFVKWWFVGAAVFFFLMGLGNYISSNVDKILVFGLATGVLTDLLTNGFLRLLEKENNEYEFYSMFYSKKLWAFFANIVYAFLVTTVVVCTYEGINKAIISANPTIYSTDDVPLAVEPLLYSLFYLIYDMAFIMLKNLFKYKIFKSKEA